MSELTYAQAPLVRERAALITGVRLDWAVAALAWWLCVALGLPSIVGIVAAVIVLLGGVGTGGIGARSWR